ncbi:MAG: hypothetical protein ACE5JK_08530, partial [Candidatus Omnitrophota bacterium]
GFESVVVDDEAYVLGWHDAKNKIIYLAFDVMEEIQSQIKSHDEYSEELLDEYLAHELICPFFGPYPACHYRAILAQQFVHEKNYTAQGLSKGFLGRVLRYIIDRKVKAIVDEEARATRKITPRKDSKAQAKATQPREEKTAPEPGFTFHGKNTGKKVKSMLELRQISGKTAITVINLMKDPSGKVEEEIDIESAKEFALSLQLFEEDGKFYLFGGGYLPPDELTSDEALRDLSIPEKLAKCFRETALSLTFNKKIVIAFDVKLAASSYEDPLGRLIQALQELKEDEAYAAILSNLVLVPADSKELPGLLEGHIAAKDTEVFVFASNDSRKDLKNIESQVHSSYIEHKDFNPDSYFPIAEVVVITLADYCESIIGENARITILNIRDKILQLSELNIESIIKKDGTLIFKLLPKARKHEKGELIRMYATLKRLLIAA